MARTKQTARGRQIHTPSHEEVEHAFSQLAKKARQSSTTGTAIQSSAVHGSVLESLPEELWYIVLTHSDLRALARLALTTRLWALRVRPAAYFRCSSPFVYKLITEAQDQQLAKVLTFVEARYGLTLSEDELGRFATGLNGSTHNQEQRAALLSGKGRVEQMAMLVTRFGSMSGPDKDRLARRLCQPVSSPHFECDDNQAKCYLTTAITLRLSPVEIIALAQDWQARGFDLSYEQLHDMSQAMARSLSRAEWTPQQLAQFWTILLDKAAAQDLFREIRSFGLQQVGAQSLACLLVRQRCCSWPAARSRSARSSLAFPALHSSAPPPSSTCTAVSMLRTLSMASGSSMSGPT